jgi:hypothetical protein
MRTDSKKRRDFWSTLENFAADLTDVCTNT